ncbi:transcriptional regulator GcvA [Pseudomonas sp. LA21]|uniref:transcriptional regulator GcvA n=1 Tax=unclassified Pseudomonas TaxID=196821 RepID=UPI001FB7644C|nr:transcriptional regulator GcvA [Pseudomonas sp. LA21]MCJ1883988.1 transcriptional regulator GcvA [Pseudomonas sp. LA21]
MSRPFPGIRSLRTFEAAGRHLNFTRAAEEVGLTPAAVSHQIKELEDQLGLTLFTRTSRSIQLTPGGALLLEAAAESLDLLRRATVRARRLSRSAEQLRVSLTARFATHWLLPRLPAFRALHPGLKLSFDVSDELRDFAVDDIDLAIRFGSGHYPGLRAERLFDTLIVPVCCPSLLTEGPPLREPRDLLAHTLCFVDCETEGAPWPDWARWMTAAGMEDFDASNCVAFDDTSHVVQAVLEGGAVGLADRALVSRELEQGLLVQPFELGVPVAEDYAYNLVYPQASADDPRVIAFRDWALAELAG